MAGETTTLLLLGLGGDFFDEIIGEIRGQRKQIPRYQFPASLMEATRISFYIPATIITYFALTLARHHAKQQTIRTPKTKTSVMDFCNSNDDIGPWF